jgi:hypothetical protein
MRAWLLAVLLLGCKNNEGEVQIGQLVTFIAVGGNHACARVAGGTLRCFGDDSAGQLGDDINAGDAGETSVPRGVVGLTAVAEIAAGFAHNCARFDDGNVRCWGANDFGQLGDGTTTARPTPAIVSIRNVHSMSAGGAHTCAVLRDRTAMCWGRNDDGQLGDGSTTTRLLPVPVSGLSNVEEIVAGRFHTCARLHDQTVRCWGRNDAGQIGDGSVGTSRSIHVAVASLSGVKAIAAGLADTCALLNDGSLRCWGRAIGRTSATNVTGFPPADEIAIAASTETELCARLVDHSVRCTTVLGGSPRPINGILNAVQISAGGFGTCARSSNGALRCWKPGQDPASVVL